MLKYVAIIPARKNSKRIPNKNLIKINHKSIVELTISSAKKSKIFDQIILSSDDKKILSIGKKLNVNIFFRPKNISNDKTSTETTLLHTIKKTFKLNEINKIENIVLLQPTSPLRTTHDIISAIKYYESKKLDSLFSCYKSKEFIWLKKDKLRSISYNFKKRARTQNMKELIFENGAIYIFKLKGFLKNKNRLFGKIGFYLMKKINSFEIDNKDDLKLIKRIIKN